jgi:hypothetical protein
MFANLKKHIVSVGLSATFLLALVLGGAASAQAQPFDRDDRDHDRWEHRDRDGDRWRHERRERFEHWRVGGPAHVSGFYDRFGRFHATGYFDGWGRFHRY